MKARGWNATSMVGAGPDGVSVSAPTDDAGVAVVCVDKAVVRILEVRLESDHRFGGQLLNLPFQVPDVAALAAQLLEDVREELLRAGVVVQELGVRLFELLRVLVEREVGKVHVHVAHVHGIWLAVILLDGKKLASANTE